ncbi:MAG TPA: UDPGP type 1 family protein [Phycisphaerae bacterium]|nr:UDPGP type 1 family protein [Phycisphaerae bacterium]
MPHKNVDEPTIRRRLAQADQGHVLHFWRRLSPKGRRKLLAQVAGIDFEQLAELITRHVTHPRPVRLPPNLKPAPFIPLPTTAADRRQRRRMHDLGEQLLAAGQVAALVVAGGQGTRLGYDGPKGEFPIGPLSGRPLFQIFADAILAARRAYGAAIPWYVMTSQANDGQTRRFFRRHGFFGLPPADVRFFRQGMVPAVDFEGKLILAAPDEVAMSPDGHGGSLLALARQGMLADMAARGIEHISYFQVDNPLVPPLDPVFIGYHAAAGSDMSSKMARKRDPLEKVGLFCTSGPRLHVIEYSDLPEKLAKARKRDGTLRSAAGSIAIHILSRAFVERLTAGGRFALPVHRAAKKIDYVDAAGKTREPDKANGVKFEMFVFDALPLARHPVVLEIDRAAEFSPAKNAEPEDTAGTARRDMMRLQAAWLEEAGVRVPRRPDGEPRFWVEINPLAARSVADLQALVRRGRIPRVLADDLYLGPQDA